MEFFSIAFLVFFVILFVLIRYCDTVSWRNRILLLFSWGFYAAWDYVLLGLLILVTFISYISAQYIKKRGMLILGIGVPLVFLGICKYLDFFISSFCMFLSVQETPLLHIMLPLGISFYTFLAISYVIDVYHQKIPVEHDFIIVALYISFFPTVVSGPITKARDLIRQFQVYEAFDWSDFHLGIQIFILGCIKKFVLADNMGVVVDEVYAAPLAFDSATVWLAVVTYSVQLYFDFSGYSDMAIGCGRMLGFRLAENFNLPYLAQNASEFWKRWHMSLSSWLQEYLYFSLGGSKKGGGRTYWNLMLTMLICGLWHGAAWNFVLWGMAHGLLLWGHRFYREHFGKTIYIPAMLKVILTFFSVTMCWVLFRGTDMTNITEVFYRLFVWNTSSVNHMYVWAWIGVAILFVMMGVTAYMNKWEARRPIINLRSVKGVFLLCFEIYILFCLMYTGNTPFVYAAF